MLQEIVKYGGFIGYLLLAGSVVALGVVLEKTYYYFKFEKKTKHICIKTLELNMFKGECDRQCTPSSLNENSIVRLISMLLREYRENESIDFYYLEERAREFTLETSLKLEKKLWILSVVTNLSPLLGLFGTVTGMISAFSVIANVGTGDPKLLADGISKALITTACGLGVAMPTAIFLNYFHKKSEELLTSMEKSSVEALNMLRRKENEIKKVCKVK
jgi:biopolymer transport protein ExbB